MWRPALEVFRDEHAEHELLVTRLMGTAEHIHRALVLDDRAEPWDAVLVPRSLRASEIEAGLGFPVCQVLTHRVTDVAVFQVEQMELALTLDQAGVPQ
jgi:hypothetical protein